MDRPLSKTQVAKDVIFGKNKPERVAEWYNLTVEYVNRCVREFQASDAEYRNRERERNRTQNRLERYNAQIRQKYGMDAPDSDDESDERPRRSRR